MSLVEETKIRISDLCITNRITIGLPKVQLLPGIALNPHCRCDNQQILGPSHLQSRCSLAAVVLS